MTKDGKITAYIRLKNEQNTITSCLESISGIFDEILIIYSDITDNSLDIIKHYLSNNSNSKISLIKYPYSVIPQRSIDYKKNTYDYKNSLAAYYNFGLSHISTEFVSKIDADQIYFKENMLEMINQFKQNDTNKIYFGVKGYNCCVINKKFLFLDKNKPLNGGLDHWMTRTSDIFFKQERLWERSYFNVPKKGLIYNKPSWIHFRQTDIEKNKPNTTETDMVFIGDNDIEKKYINLNQEIIEKYNKYAKPLFVQYSSIYKELLLC